MSQYREIVLQNILWPEVDICMYEDMYFRTNEKAKRVGEEIRFIKGGLIWTDTYFNSVSVDKWKKYTMVKKLTLTLFLKGDFLIRLVYKKKVHRRTNTRIAAEVHIHNMELQPVQLMFPEGEGMAFFNLEALNANSIFKGGYYSSEVDEPDVRDVKIGIGICTYRREKYVENNLQTLKKNILKNPNSELYGHLEVFVADNGQSLDGEKLSGEEIHIVRNKNAGGAAGFTRDMIEIMEANEQDCGITHILLMDDDIVLLPEALFRTYRLLTVLKDPYSDAFIGGAMMRSDDRNIQVEAGASWNMGRLISLKQNLDMCLCDSCLYNEVEEYAEFNAWWYCCFPASVVTESNLPIPIFIRGDDVEYGLRNMKHLILLNGICVWHEPFENKYSSSLSYYILRNQFIDNALYFPNYKKKTAMKEVSDRVIREILYYRYKNADLLIRGVRDFLKGIDWLKQSDGEKINYEVQVSGYRALPLEELQMPFLYSIYEKSLSENDSKFRRIFRLASGNGYLLRARRDNIVSMSMIRPYNAYRVKRLLNYDMVAQKGFITERNRREAIRCLIDLGKLLVEMDAKYERVTQEYRRRCKEIQNIRFWRKYLDL